MIDDIPQQSEQEQLQRKSSDRRTHSDRRRTIAPWTGDEYRKANRRNAIDRRGLPFGVFYKSTEPLPVLYAWLRNNCGGKWSVGIEEAEEEAVKKTLKVLFEQESDKDTFMENVVRNGSAA